MSQTTSSQLLKRHLLDFPPLVSLYNSSISNFLFKNVNKKLQKLIFKKFKPKDNFINVILKEKNVNSQSKICEYFEISSPSQHFFCTKDYRINFLHFLYNTYQIIDYIYNPPSKSSKYAIGKIIFIEFLINFSYFNLCLF